MGIEKAKAYAENLVQTALKALELFDKKADPLRGIARYIIERNK
jgi:geranylgeranyl diphosphate synthase type II